MILFIYQALSIFTVSLCSNVQDKSPYIARQVKQHPASIEKKCGQSAVIHCILSNGSFSEDLHLVWYRYIAKHQREKIGEINLKTQNMTAANNVQLLWNPDKLSAELRISHLKTSNSGSYGCELVSFNNKMNIKKDQPTNLTVTEEPAHPGRENRTNSNAEKPTGNMMRIEIILAAVISALLIVALLTYITVMYWPPKKDPNTRLSIQDARCQGEDPISTVYSSDYAVLKAPGRIDPENPTLSFVLDDPCYATVVFSPEQQAASVQKIPSNN